MFKIFRRVMSRLLILPRQLKELKRAHDVTRFPSYFINFLDWHSNRLFAASSESYGLSNNNGNVSISIKISHFSGLCTILDAEFRT
jgi:steroid 5-alpha reductase family enzyme